jgi:hypothetical protein
VEDVCCTEVFCEFAVTACVVGFGLGLGLLTLVGSVGFGSGLEVAVLVVEVVVVVWLEAGITTLLLVLEV